MALKTDLGDGGLEIWDEWSKTCPEKYAEGVCVEKWRSFTGGGDRPVGLGTLFAIAKKTVSSLKKRVRRGTSS